MAVIILAGGKSRRMGHKDKAFLKIGNEPIIKRQARLLRKYFKKIIIITGSLDEYIGLKGVKLIPDIIPGQGPLGGIFSGLRVSQDTYNFVVACDMPFINCRLIKYMLENSAGFDVVVPRINHSYEPLFSVYSKSCLKHIKPLLDKKILKVSKFFPKVKLRQISRDEVLRFGLPEKIFMNLNTQGELARLNA
jgi:molybdenum cofactor guanylyltransferase